MADSEERRAALCVGVSRYTDRKLSSALEGAESARDVASALEKTDVRTVRTLLNPATSMDFFSGLQSAIKEARGGTLILYFAGFVAERDGDLLFAVRDSEVGEKKGYLPWSDVEDVARREGVKKIALVLNAEKLSGAVPTKAFKHPGLYAIGSVRTFDDQVAAGNVRAYAEALIKGLTRPLAEVEPLLADGLFDARALDRWLAANTAADLSHTAFRTADDAIAFRSFQTELEAAKKKAEEARKKAEEEAAAKKKAEEEEAAAAKKKAEEEEAAAKKKAEEEEAAAKKKKAEEEAAAAKKKAEEEEAAAKKKAEEEAAEHDDEVTKVGTREELAAAARKAEAEAAALEAKERAEEREAEHEEVTKVAPKEEIAATSSPTVKEKKKAAPAPADAHAHAEHHADEGPISVNVWMIILAIVTIAALAFVLTQK